MYKAVKLVYRHYEPGPLEKGMLFAVIANVNDYEYLHLHALEAIPRDIEKYIRENGFPVKPYLVQAVSTNPDVPEVVVAYPDQIDWIEYNGDEYQMDVDMMNYVSLNDHGYVAIYMENDQAVLDEDGKVILCDVDYLLYYDEDNEDLDWNDETSQWETKC
jgi:hypothetical protein